METIRVVAADDHALFRKGLVTLLSSSRAGIEVVGEANNGLEALELARELMPDIILMDITMPVCNGLEATRLIKAEMPYVKIIILTVSDAEQDLFQAIKVGAHGYLLKNLEPEDLIHHLKGVQKGEAAISPTVASKILAEFSRRMALEPGPEDALTRRERQVLQLVARGDTNRAIASALCITENTVKNHLGNILEKLHLQNRVQATAFALQHGLATKPSAPRPNLQQDSRR